MDGKKYNLWLPRVKIGETETIWDNLNPDFQKSFIVDFIFEKKQTFKVEARDLDNESGKTWDALGSVEFQMGKLIGAKGSMLILELKHKRKNMGKLIIRAEKVSRKNDILTFDFFLSGLSGFGICSSEKPFIEYCAPF